MIDINRNHQKKNNIKTRIRVDEFFLVVGASGTTHTFLKKSNIEMS
jgi:hypothetical protein